jgi:indolepyruvate ferredoxin oxidoreductase beta subunit
VSAVTSVLLAGVGGQGVLLASEVLAEVAGLAGHDVKKSEVHGMAQRGGSVVSHLRFGEKVSSPLIPRGGADFAVSFELLETLRYLDVLCPGAIVVVNEQQILPLPVSVGKATYPLDVHERLLAAGVRAHFVDGSGLAAAAGNAKAVNAVILGALSAVMDFPVALWEQALERQVPAKLLAVNLKAFALGREALGARRDGGSAGAAAVDAGVR